MRKSRPASASISSIEAPEALASGTVLRADPESGLIALAQVTRDAVFVTSRDGTILYSNASCEAMFGYESIELLGRHIALVLPSLSLGEITPTPFELDGVRKDGNEIPIETSLVPTDWHGTYGLVINVRGASPRASLQAALEQTENRYRALFEHNPHAMFVYERDTLRILSVNTAAIALYGYTQKEFASMRITDIRPAEEVAPFLQYIGGRPAGFVVERSWRHRNKRGDVFEVEVVSQDVMFDDRRCRLVLIQDVSATRKAEVLLEESERRFRDMLENVQLIAVVLDSLGRVTFCNEFFVGLSGHERASILGGCWFDLCLPEDLRQPHRDAFRQNFALGTIAPQSEHEIVTRFGERRLISWSHTVLRDAAGRITGTASVGTDITDKKRAEQQLLHDALHDSLTGLPNRALFLERLEGAIARAKRRDDYVYAVLFVDLDRFKVINESLGHRIGDRLLIEAGRLLQSCVRPQDTVSRLGGDEYTILLDDIADVVQATRIANRIHELMRSPFDLDGHAAFTTVSIGIALSTTGYDEPGEVLRDADTAMYRAKALGKARHETFDKSMHRRAVALLELETELRRAVERMQFSLAYQPIVSMRTGAVTGFEALIRWKHPAKGMVSPADFIPIAEETGLILPIGHWVLERACAQMNAWSDVLSTPLSISVNLSSKQFASPTLVDDILATLVSKGLKPGQLKLEITESVLMENAERAARALEKLRAQGIRISIDDFGTGYSSLSYLLRFPVDTLKIDRAFVSGMSAGGADSLELVRTIVTLARNLNMDVVAEGVETEEQRIRLEALGCQHAQGYLFSRPLDAEVAGKLIESNLPLPVKPSTPPIK